MKDVPQQDSHAFSPVTFEAIPFWTDDTTSIELVIQYRINQAFLFFTKTIINKEEAYEAQGELVVEILDENDVAVTRDIKPLRIERAALPSEDVLQQKELQGVFVFRLKNKSYKISLEAKDVESGKSFVNRDTKVIAQPFSPFTLNISQAIFVETLQFDTSSRTKEFIPVNHGGNLMIGQKGGCLFQVYSPDTSTNFHPVWKLNSKNETDEDLHKQLQGEQFLQWNGVPAIVENQGRVFYKIKSSSGHSKVIFIPLPIERLEEGKYSLTLTADQGKLKSMREFSFNVIWPMKPRSLTDFKLAIEALRHIATEDEINQMTGLSKSSALKKFRDFWQKRNSDTTRAYNSVMAEYYRRVDESIRRFSLENEFDGYRTDRGRIFILFGTPTKMDRLLKPDKPPTEIWTYEKLKRRFIFTDVRKTGNYILVQTENY